MTYRLPLFFSIALSIGIALVGLLWPRRAASPGLSLWVALGFGFGTGLISFLQFFWLLIHGAWSPGMNLLLFGCGAVAVGLIFYRSKFLAPQRSAAPSPTGPEGEIQQILAGYFWVFLIIAVLISIFYFYQNPHGAWDAWSHWNLRARFVFRGGEGWNRALGAEYWNPLNYPLFLPMLVSSAWGFLQRETQWVPGGVALGFTLAMVFLLQGSLARLRSRAQGYLAATLLLGTPFFLTHGNSQYSDIPLGFYFLLTFVLAALHDREGGSAYLGLAGVAAGLAAWNKNEGLLFIGCFSLVRFATVLWEKGWRAAFLEAFVFALGVLPVLAVDFYVKTQMYPPATIFQTRNVPYTYIHFTEWIRYKKVTTAYVRTFFQFGEWRQTLPAFLIAYFFWMKSTRESALRWTSARVYLALLMMLGGYFMVYLATPHDVDWLLRTSVQRLFLCMWPSALFAFFLLTRSPEEALARPISPQS